LPEEKAVLDATLIGGPCAVFTAKAKIERPLR
jgi:hypothetical protein